MSKLKEEIKLIEVQGTSGGGLVNITMSGDYEIKSLQIDDSIISIAEKSLLSDLIIAAYNDARHKVKNITGEKMKDLTNGLPIPQGMNIPGLF